MNESDFDKQVTDTLLHIEQAIEESGADIDFEAAGGILTLEFENGSKIIINKQGAASQIWVAAKSGGFHYSLVEGRWINDQSGGELMSELSRLVSEQSGQDIDLD
ncbi:MAG: iron donor protein CyaY [Gammaproteobacteria bacterium]|nr:iron donor protein CyaY [Gammaproteobacteria bacterium]MDH3371160.1 iron donor protein CyaY [Gammaproteobacteria bacterium]MDH3405774.1 iron donor protein CyaY [Gammaproteobacteria bacterium]MDH3563180.1 iron donor protein CyaY [Gammaproteobacteria bacterium]MDH5487983.1 iron donor protein CyaY [Gammaproteobacteria bacterium]